MIIRLLCKIGFKVALPVVASVGLISYMSYTQGGDPLAYARMMVGNSNSANPLERASESVAGTFDAIYDKTSGSLSAVSRQLSIGDQPDLAAAKGQNSGSIENDGSIVYRWKDAAGNTHFGSHPDDDAIDIVPISVSKGNRSSSSDSNTSSGEPVSSATKGANNDSVPGMPDIKFPGGIRLPEGLDYRRITGQIDIPD